jgi:hypothetical protein
MNEARIVEQLDKMVASGRMTQAEAENLRTAQGTPDFEVALGAIRARHASAYLEAAVEAGEMTPQDAEDQSQRLLRGEHPKGLRARLRMHRRGGA